MKKYIKPEITKIELDNSISLVMMAWNPGDGMPSHPPGRPPDKPWPPHGNSSFQSPFDNRLFN